MSSRPCARRRCMRDETVVDVVREGRDDLVLVVAGEGRCDLGVVDAVAWVCLAARRAGARARVRTTSVGVVELLALTGVDEHCEIVWQPTRLPIRPSTVRAGLGPVAYVLARGNRWGEGPGERAVGRAR